MALSSLQRFQLCIILPLLLSLYVCSQDRFLIVKSQSKVWSRPKPFFYCLISTPQTSQLLPYVSLAVLIKESSGQEPKSWLASVDWFGAFWGCCRAVWWCWGWVNYTFWAAIWRLGAGAPSVYNATTSTCIIINNNSILDAVHVCRHVSCRPWWAEYCSWVAAWMVPELGSSAWISGWYAGTAHHIPLLVSPAQQGCALCKLAQRSSSWGLLLGSTRIVLVLRAATAETVTRVI